MTQDSEEPTVQEKLDEAQTAEAECPPGVESGPTEQAPDKGTTIEDLFRSITGCKDREQSSFAKLLGDPRVLFLSMDMSKEARSGGVDPVALLPTMMVLLTIAFDRLDEIERKLKLAGSGDGLATDSVYHLLMPCIEDREFFEEGVMIGCMKSTEENGLSTAQVAHLALVIAALASERCYALDDRARTVEEQEQDEDEDE